MKVITAQSFVSPRGFESISAPSPEKKQVPPLAEWEQKHDAALPQIARVFVQSIWRPAESIKLPSPVTALLAELCVLVYREPEIIRAGLKARGFADPELFPEPKFRGDRSRPPRALAILDGQRIFLAFRGTMFREDWFYNFRCEPCGDPRRHAGFERAWNEVAADVRRWIQSRWNDGMTLHLAGHSLGGAIATIAALEFATNSVPVSGVVTVGSPKVGGAEFFEAYEGSGLSENTLRYQHGIDIVASAMPPFLYRHVCKAERLPAQSFQEVVGLIRDESSAGGHRMEKVKALLPDGGTMQINGVVVETHTQNLGYVLGVLLTLVMYRLGWTRTAFLFPHFGRWGKQGHTGVQHHASLIYARILSPTKILGDYLDLPDQQQPGAWRLVVAALSIAAVAAFFGGWVVALWTFFALLGAIAVGVLVAIAIEMRRDRKTR